MAIEVLVSGLTTVIEALPALAMREAGTVALSRVVETKVVARAVVVVPAVQSTTDAAPKLLPLTVRVKAGPPACADFGAMLDTSGGRNATEIG